MRAQIDIAEGQAGHVDTPIAVVLTDFDGDINLTGDVDLAGLGAVDDAAWDGDGDGSVNAVLKASYALLELMATAAHQVTAQTALDAILDKIIAEPATEAKQDTIITALAAIEAAITPAGATEAGQDTANTALAAIAAALAGDLAVTVADTLAVTSPGPTTATATIAEGESLSDAVEVQGKLVGLVMPASWNAAALTFQASVDDGATFHNVYDATERTVASATAGAGRFIALSLNDWLGVTHVKVRSGTAGAAVNQDEEREIILALAG